MRPNPLTAPAASVRYARCELTAQRAVRAARSDLAQSADAHHAAAHMFLELADALGDGRGAYFCQVAAGHHFEREAFQLARAKEGDPELRALLVAHIREQALQCFELALGSGNCRVLAAATFGATVVHLQMGNTDQALASFEHHRMLPARVHIHDLDGFFQHEMRMGSSDTRPPRWVLDQFRGPRAGGGLS